MGPFTQHVYGLKTVNHLGSSHPFAKHARSACSGALKFKHSARFNLVRCGHPFEFLSVTRLERRSDASRSAAVASSDFVAVLAVGLTLREEAGDDLDSGAAHGDFLGILWGHVAANRNGGASHNFLSVDEDLVVNSEGTLDVLSRSRGGKEETHQERGPM